MFEKIKLCDRCVAAILSRGEKVYVGSSVEGEILVCEWCEEESFELKECLL